MSSELEIVSQAVELSSRIKNGLVLDRSETKKLLRQLEKFGPNIVGCEVMLAQLRSILSCRDWLTISIEAESPSAVRATGVHIGIVQSKSAPKKTRLSPMQKWQQKHGLGRR